MRRGKREGEKKGEGDNSLKDDILSNSDKMKHNSNMAVSTKSV